MMSEGKNMAYLVKADRLLQEIEKNEFSPRYLTSIAVTAIAYAAVDVAGSLKSISVSLRDIRNKE